MAECDKEKTLHRRQFLARLAKAGASVAGACGIAGWLYDSRPPPAQPSLARQVTVPHFPPAVPGGATMSIVEGSERTKTAPKAIELLGGIERFVKPGETVFIKPNAAFASPASLGATTNPDLVACIVELCYHAGAKQVIVADNPINDPASCFSVSGIAKAASRAGAKVILPQPQMFKTTTLSGGKLIKNWPIFYGPLAEADRLIGIAPVKNHYRAGASMAMKNWYGLLGGRRNIFHQDINTIIAELAQMVRPSLVILDGTQVMVTNGPTGGSTSDLKRANVMIASCDPVAADAFGCSLLGLNVSDLPYLRKAEQAGAGVVDYESLKPLTATA